MKTHGDWTVRRLADGASEWVSPHGFTFWVDHAGTHPLRTNHTTDGAGEGADTADGTDTTDGADTVDCAAERTDTTDSKDGDAAV